MPVNQRQGKRGTKWYLRLQHNGHRMRRVLAVSGRSEALKVEAWALSMLDKGHPPEALDTDCCELIEQAQDGPAMTLRAGFDRALLRGWYDNKTRDSVYAPSADLLCAYLGPDLPIANITNDVLWSMWRAMKDGSWSEQWTDRTGKAGKPLSQSSINTYFSVLGGMMAMAEEWQNEDGTPVINRAPNMKQFRKRPNNERVSCLTDDMEARLLAYFGGGVMHDYCMLQLDTGFRPSEGLRLEPRLINWERGVAGVEDAKGNKQRRVPLSKRCLSMLETRCAGLSPTAKVFGELTYDDASAAWDRARAAFGLTKDPDMVLYIMRHTCLTRLARLGYSEFEIQAWAGHSDPKMSARYIHLTGEHLVAARNAREA